MSQGMLIMQGHLARTLWSLGTEEERLGNGTLAGELRSAAGEVRLKIGEFLHCPQSK